MRLEALAGTLRSLTTMFMTLQVNIIALTRISRSSTIMNMTLLVNTIGLAEYQGDQLL